MTATSLHLLSPEITREQLERVANTLSVDLTSDSNTLREKCFERSYQVCQSGQWHLVKPIVQELSVLVDKVGRTLLMKAVMEEKDVLVQGLTERAIAVTTKDAKGKTILHYLACFAAGNSSDEYAAAIIKKLYVQNKQETLAPLIKEIDDLQKINHSNQQQVIAINAGSVQPAEGIKILKKLVGDDRHTFACLHAGTLMYLRILEMLQHSQNIPDAAATKDEFQRGFLSVYGFQPIPFEKYSKEVLAQAQQGQDDGVDRFLDSCATRFKVSRDTRVIDLLKELVNTYFYSERFDRALCVIEQILLVPETVKRSDLRFFAEIDRVAGRCYSRLHNYKEAEFFYNRAIDFYHNKAEFLGDYFVCLAERLDLFIKVRNLKQAEDDCRKVLEFAQNTKLPPTPYLLCDSLSIMANILYHKRNYTEALRYGELALEIYEKAGAKDDPTTTHIYISTLGIMGNSLTHQSKYNDALGYHQKIINHLEKEEVRYKNDIAAAYLDLGNVYSDMNRFDDAFKVFKRVYDFTDPQSSPHARSHAAAAASLGNICLYNKKFADAIRYAQEACMIFEQLQDSLPREEWKMTTFEIQVGAYYLWEWSLIATKNFKDALIVSDKRRARCLVDNLTKRVFSQQITSSDLTLEDIEKIATEQKTTFIIYSIPIDRNGQSAGEKGTCWVVSRDEKITERVTARNINIKNVFPNGVDILFSETPYRGKDGNPPLPVTDLYGKLNILTGNSQENSEKDEWAEMVMEAKKVTLQEESPIQEGFLDTSLSGNSSTIHNEAQSEANVNWTEQLEAVATSLGEDAEKDEWNEILLSAQKAALEDEPKIRAQFHTHLKEWYRELILPIEDLLPKPHEGTVTFIPDGPMAMLPFAIFEQEDGRYFVEDYASLVAPSIKVVSLLENLRPQKSGQAASGKSVVVCNPDSKSVKKLQTGDREGNEVGKLLNTPSSHLKLGRDAKAGLVISLINDVQWIHWSSHGEIEDKEISSPNPYSLYQGHLYFTPDVTHQQGILYAEEISKMNLQAELAFLSACYSGRGSTENIHEGLVGFTRAFASSGVLTTATSYWKLPDTDETVDMITIFYRLLLDKNGPKLGKAEALQKAMLEAIKCNREDPHKWGALFLTGIN